MATIYDMPAETLQRIITCIHPGEFEAFALSCTATYIHSRRYIEAHNAMMKKWRHQVAPEPLATSIFCLLLAIARDPEVAQYIESLDLNPVFGTPLSMNLNQLSEVGDAEKEEIKTLVRGANFLKQANVGWIQWWDFMLSEEEAPTNPLRRYPCVYCVLTLIALLPNLKKLSLPRCWDIIGEMINVAASERLLESLATRVVNTIVTWSTKGLKGDQPLGRLKVILPPKDRYGRMPRYFQGAQPFMALPSVRDVYGANWIMGSICVRNQTFQSNFFRYPASHPPSSITRLELASCHLDSNSISDILRHTPLLKIFRYSHDSKPRLWKQQRDFNAPAWNPRLFNDTVSAYCGQTIVELALTGDNIRYEYFDDAISSFHGYPNLEVLEIDTRMFRDKSVTRNRYGVEESVLPRPLVSMLPDTIIEVDLNIAHETNGKLLRSLLRGLEKSCNNELSNLDTFVVREHKCYYCIQKIAKKHWMITVENYGMDVGVLDTLDEMPIWKYRYLKTTRIPGSDRLE